MIKAIKALFTSKPHVPKEDFTGYDCKARVPNECITGYDRWQNCSCGWVANMFSHLGAAEKCICPECASEELTTVIGQWHYIKIEGIHERHEPTRFEPKVCKFLEEYK